MPAISVIVPVFNAADFLDRCITSILSQEFSDFEVIFIDDGSHDGSAGIIQRFARNDSRVILEKHRTNLGPGSARNTGIAKARASYLTFVDSDDFVDPNLLQALIKATDNGFFDIVETGCRAIDSDEELLWEYCPIFAKYADLSTVNDSMLLVREWGMHQKLWRKSLFTDNDIRFPEGVFWEDIAVVPVVVACARSLAKIDFIGYNYLQRLDSITSTRSAKHIADLFLAFEYFRRFLYQRAIYLKYSKAFEKSVSNATAYFVEHMTSRNLSNQDLSGKLIRVCRLIVDRYLADKTIVERVPPMRLRQIIEESLSFDVNESDSTLQLAIMNNLVASRVS